MVSAWWSEGQAGEITGAVGFTNKAGNFGYGDLQRDAKGRVEQCPLVSSVPASK